MSEANHEEKIPTSLNQSPVVPGADETLIWDAFRNIFVGTEEKYLPKKENEGTEEVPAADETSDKTLVD